MVESNCSMVTQLAYELEVLRAKRANAKQRREETAKALAEANTRMEAIIKQRVTDSLDKAIAWEKKATKTKRDYGDIYKDLYSSKA
uniref:Uncharacterized protein n=1 Tax=Cannabis sativa TaxID=3483 RepID=A0A803P1U3_CANSA